MAFLDLRHLDLASVDGARALGEVLLEAREALFLAAQLLVGLGRRVHAGIDVGEQAFPALEVAESPIELGRLRRDRLALGGHLGAEPVDLGLALGERLAIALQSAPTLGLGPLAGDEGLTSLLEIGCDLFAFASRASRSEERFSSRPRCVRALSSSR